MTRDLDDRLTDHLRQQATADASAPTEIDAIRRIAKRRTMRTRAAVGACGLLALAGLGSLVPTRGESNALVTANDPAPTEEARPAPTPAPAIVQSDDEPALPATDAIPPGTEAAGAPQAFGIFGDGQGGFAAVGTRTSTGLVRFVRSTDGENWYWANDWQLPEGRFLERVERVDNTFIAVFDTVYHASAGTRAVLNPLLARSNDLENWSFIDLPLGLDADDDAVLEEYFIGDFAVNGPDVLMWVGAVPQIDYEKYGINQREVCGGTQSETSIALTLCDDSILPIDELDGWHLRPTERVLLSQDGEPAELTSVLDDVVDPDRNISAWWRFLEIYPSQTSFDATYIGDEATDVASGSLTNDVDDTAILTVVARSANERMLLVHTDGRLIPVLRNDADDEDQIGTLPDSISAATTLPGAARIAAGPAGWALAVADSSFPLIDIDRDGWILRSFGLSSAQLLAADGSELISYNSQSSELPPAVQVGLFGGMRYYRPGTNELLFELSADEADIVTAPSLLPDGAVFDQSLTVDGWTVSGNPIVGPLVLTSPTGETREFADGYAFDNDDITDGVEMALSSNLIANSALRSATPMQFFDDNGDLLVEFRGRPLFDTLVVPVLGHPTDERGAQSYPPKRFEYGQSWVLFSADGLSWDVIWTDGGDTSLPLTNLVVGDDEVLIAQSSRAIRIPVDE